MNLPLDGDNEMSSTDHTPEAVKAALPEGPRRHSPAGTTGELIGALKSMFQEIHEKNTHLADAAKKVSLGWLYAYFRGRADDAELAMWLCAQILATSTTKPINAAHIRLLGHSMQQWAQGQLSLIMELPELPAPGWLENLMGGDGRDGSGGA